MRRGAVFKCYRGLDTNRYHHACILRRRVDVVVILSMPMSSGPRRIGPGPNKGMGEHIYPGMHCWSCKHVFDPQNSLFCTGCEKLQSAPKTQNFFELLQVPVSLFVDQGTLERNYQNLQRFVHPDRFVSKSKEEQAIAVARSAAASEAYQTLKDPMARARYVLAMRGIDLERCPLEDPELLMQVMEERELLDSAKGDAVEVAQGVLRRSQEEMDQSLRAAEELIQNHGDEAMTPVTHLIIRAQYYNRLLNHARSIIDVLEQRKKSE